MDLEPKPTNPTGCHACRWWRPLTAVHDDARGGWLQLGRCVEPAMPKGLTDPDYECGDWQNVRAPEPEDTPND